MADLQRLREIIEKQRPAHIKEHWAGTAFDYLTMVKEDPTIARFAPGRIYNMIMGYGTSLVPEEEKTRGYEDLVRYNFFDDRIFGTLEPIHDIMRFLNAAAKRTETGKRILIMVGPVASGKSTIAHWFKKGLERDPVQAICIKGCPFQEDPLSLVPEWDRPMWQGELGVKIEGTVCPVCQHNIDKNYTNPDGSTNWENVEVETFLFSEQRRKGIGTFQPSDPKSQDISELIGSVNMAKISRFGESHPKAYQFDGELQVGNRGMVEYIEILKADIKFHHVLITLTQEQVIKAPRFPQIYIDTLLLSHTNQTEFDKFKAKKENEALHDRMYKVKVPYNIKVDDEIKILQKMIDESDFANVHIAPNTLKVAAQWAILSRLTPSAKVDNLVKKMKIYNDELVDDFKKEEFDVKALKEEGKSKGEGMNGISPRYVIDSLNVALGSKEEKNCINPVDAIRALRNHFAHAIGITDEDQNKYEGMLVGEKDSVSAEYKEIAKKEINIAFLHAYEEQANTLFDNYMENAEAFCKKEKKFDSITGEYTEPDEQLMRAIEELINIPVNSKDTFRNGIFVHKTTCLERNEEFTFRSYPPLKEGVEKKLMMDLKNVVSLTLADSSKTGKKVKQRRASALKRLVKNPDNPKSHEEHCNHCANNLLAFVGEILRRE
jgi:serine protein kinase